MKRQTKTIDTFFRKCAKTDESVKVTVSQPDGATSPEDEIAVLPDSSVGTLPVPSVSITSVDIGSISDALFSNEKMLVPEAYELKQKTLNDLFVPDEKFVFPTTELKNKKLKFQKNWLNRWPWLSYSAAKDGAYCKWCVSFGREFVGKGSNQKIGSLVAAPFKKWKDAVDKFTSHQNTEYHKFSCVAAENFSKIAKREQDDVMTLLDSKRKKEREQNRAALKPLIDTVVYCGENELPLRGHRDSGSVTLEKPEDKEGKFRALIRFKASTDKNLQNHLLESHRNASYVSPEIQNEIIQICGDLIQKHIVTSINKAECFSILGDETLDISGKEQFSFCVRYLSNDPQPTMREEFLCFTSITDLTAGNISKVILDICNSLGLNMNKMVGQGYDGCSTFSGNISGVHERIQELYPKAIYVHCAAHRLNLVLSQSTNVPNIRNSFGVVGEITNLFRNNPQANDLLKEKISSMLPSSKKTRLTGLCQTRFIERQVAITDFLELFPAIVESLEELSLSVRNISTTASTLLSSVEKGGFVVGLYVCEFVFEKTLPLARYLQKTDVELSSAVKYTDDIASFFKEIREGKEAENEPGSFIFKEFSDLFGKAEQTMQEVFSSKIEVPRQASKQTKRENVPHNTPEEYYRRVVFHPCLDAIIQGLQDRFSKNRSVLEAFDILLPKNIDPAEVKKLKSLELFYKEKTTQSAVENEYLLWCHKWRVIPKEKRPQSLMAALDACNKNFYSDIHYLLNVLVALPVSTCEVERSFSSLKRIKNYLRNSMLNERLNGLALMSIHYPVPFTTDQVLDEMAKKPNRKLIL